MAHTLFGGEGPGAQEVGTFHRVCRPTVHPRLSDFCLSLTGLSQAEVDAAAPLPQVLEELQAWLRSLHLPDAALASGMPPRHTHRMGFLFP